MMGDSKCVHDRLNERENELKDQLHLLAKIMSRSEDARMEQIPSVYKDLVDQMVGKEFDNLIQEMIAVPRDGYKRDFVHPVTATQTMPKHGLCDDNQSNPNKHSVPCTHFPYPQEMTPSPDQQQQSAVFQSNEIIEECRNNENEITLQPNEDSSLNSSPTPSQPSSQSQLQNIIQDEEHVSDFELMTVSERISSNLSKTSPLEEFKIYEKVDDMNYKKDICEEMMDNGQNEEQSDELYRDDQTTRNDSNLSEVNGQLDRDMSEDGQHGNDEELAVNDQVDDEGSVAELNELEHVKNQASSQYSVRECRIDDLEKKVDHKMESIESSAKRWTWNEVEKCWELMMNGQIGGDEGNDEVGDDNESEVEDMDKDDQHVGNCKELFLDGQVSDDEDSDGELNGLGHVKNIDGPGTQKHKLTRSIPSGLSQASLQHLVKKCKIYDVDDEMESTSIKRWTWNEEEKCWELMKNFRIDGDEGNSEDGVDQLNGSNIDGTEVKVGQFSKIVPSGQVVVTLKKPTDKHVCEHCLRQLKGTVDLDNHIRSNTVEQPFVCPWTDCHESTFQICKMISHLQTHSDKLPIS